MGRYGPGTAPKGRMRATRAELIKIRNRVNARSRGRCEACFGTNGPFEQHHVIPRSGGGPDAVWNLINLCQADHAMVDAPYMKGRLLTELAWVDTLEDVELLMRDHYVPTLLITNIVLRQPNAIRVSWVRGASKFSVDQWKFVRLIRLGS